MKKVILFLSLIFTYGIHCQVNFLEDKKLDCFLSKKNIKLTKYLSEKGQFTFSELSNRILFVNGAYYAFDNGQTIKVYFKKGWAVNGKNQYKIESTYAGYRRARIFRIEVLVDYEVVRVIQ